jgi:hypothetical protein
MIYPKYAPQFNKVSYADFESALFKARLRMWISRFTHRCNSLLSLQEMRADQSMHTQRKLGLQVVALDKIVGSDGRAHDFDRAFFPRNIHAKGRWINIAAAVNAEIPLPPVELFKVGDFYFVSDGHHRISVARTRGQSYIDAMVTELHSVVAICDESCQQMEGKATTPPQGLASLKINSVACL